MTRTSREPGSRTRTSSAGSHLQLVAEIALLVPVRVMLMHEAKGAEYRGVVVLALDRDVVPLEERLLSANDEARLDKIMNTE